MLNCYFSVENKNSPFSFCNRPSRNHLIERSIIFKDFLISTLLNQTSTVLLKQLKQLKSLTVFKCWTKLI